MAKSKRPHPRLEARQGSSGDFVAAKKGKFGEQLPPWKKRPVFEWEDIHADTKTMPIVDCAGCYVIENPKVDEVLKVTTYKGRVTVMRLTMIRDEGTQGFAEERYDGARRVHRLLNTQGVPLEGTYRFRTKRSPATVNSTGGSP